MKCAFLMMLAGSAFAQTPALTLHIETATGKAQFQMGAPISVKLTFENSSTEIWRVPGVEGGGRSVLGIPRDHFLVSPKEGTADPWYSQLHGIIAYNGPGGTGIGATPVEMNVDLNEWVRFSRPGRYAVSASFQANSVKPPEVAVGSNEIEIEIVPADDKWLASQLRQALTVLAGPAAGFDHEAFLVRRSAMRALSYLDTPDSVRETARLMGTVDEQTAYQLRDVMVGSRDQAAAIAAMNQLLRSPDQAVTPVFIQTLAAIESAQQFPYPDDPHVKDPDIAKREKAVAAAEQQIRSELAIAIAQKRGEAKAVSLNTVMTGIRYGSVTDDLRAQLAAVFMDLPSREQTNLLGGQWKTIAGPAMIPVLRRIYENPPKDPAQSLVPLAVPRLYELDPAGTRPLILDEIKRDPLRLPPATLAILDDATLPEMDRVLLDHLQRGPWQQDNFAELIARYATADILDGVKAWYEKGDAMRRTLTSPDLSDVAPSSCQAALIGYFLRVDPEWGGRVLRSLLNDHEAYPRGECWKGIVGKTAKYNAGPVWEKVAIEALANPAGEVRDDAVRTLGKYGSATAEPALMDAFGAWHDAWKDRPAEEVSADGSFEAAFFQALVMAHNWIATREELEKVRDFCLQSGWRAEAERYLRIWSEPVSVQIYESRAGDVGVWLQQYPALPLDAARARLLQIPAGTRLKWQVDARRTPEINAWLAAIESELAGRGVVITP